MIDNECFEIPTKKEPDSHLPRYASEGAAGADVCAHIEEAISLDPSESILIPTGLSFELPGGYEIQVRPRSGLALRHQITVLNTPATIDSDYRGELKIILINHGKEAFVIEPGMRIAQIVVAKVMQASFVECEDLSTTARGTGGFGHTGMKHND